MYSESAPRDVMSKVSRFSNSCPLSIFHDVQGLVSALRLERTVPPSYISKFLSRLVQ